jgi:hypothetical protein
VDLYTFEMLLQEEERTSEKGIVMKQNALMRRMKKGNTLNLMILQLMMVGCLLQTEGRKGNQYLEMRK